jgi:hypothetical protein
MLAGPIAKVSLRRVLTVHSDMIEVTHTSKSDSFLGVRINGNVDWNETMRSLQSATRLFACNNRALDIRGSRVDSNLEG